MTSNNDEAWNNLTSNNPTEQVKQKVTQAYMFEAYYCYVQWGATAKVTDLGNAISQLFAVTRN